METNDDSLTTRLDQLESRLQQYAHWLAQAAPELEPGDVYQEMTLAIIIRAQQDPDFLRQTDYYILFRGAGYAKTAIRKQRTYRRYVDTPEEEEQLKYIPGTTTDPEQALARTEFFAQAASIIDTLPERQAAIATLLILGWQQVEIAHRLGVSRSSISQHVSRIRKAFTQLTYSPQPHY